MWICYRTPPSVGRDGECVLVWSASSSFSPPRRKVRGAFLQILLSDCLNTHDPILRKYFSTMYTCVCVCVWCKVLMRQPQRISLRPNWLWRLCVVVSALWPLETPSSLLSVKPHFPHTTLLRYSAATQLASPTKVSHSVWVSRYSHAGGCLEPFGMHMVYLWRVWVCVCVLQHTLSKARMCRSLVHPVSLISR